MRRIISLVILALVAPAFAGCLGENLDAGDIGAASASMADFGLPIVTDWTYEQVSTVVDGLTVTMEVYLPDPAHSRDGIDAAAFPATFPTVMMQSPYNGEGVGPNLDFGGYVAYEGLYQRLVQYGYAIVIADSGAMGGASGCWDFMGPQDVAQTVAAVKAVTSQPWSNGKVGMHGLSYDAMTQVMAASAAAPGLVTVVPAAALTSAYKGLYMGGIHYGGGWHTTAGGYTESSMAPRTNPERQDGWLEGFSQASCTPETVVNAADASYNAWWQERDFVPRAGDVTASVFVIQGFLDPAVKPDNFGAWFDTVPTAKKAWLGWWVHTYPTADKSGREDLILTLHRWFDHELKGIENGIMDEPAIDVMDSQGNWRHETAWPPSDTGTLTLYPGADPTLARDANAGSFSVTPDNGLPFITASESATTGLAFADGLHIVGVPTLTASVSSNTAGGQLIAELYDVDAKGQARLITRGAQNLQLADDASARAPLTPGDSVTAIIGFYPTDYALPAGHNLDLRLRTQESASGGWFDPDPFRATLTVTTGAEATWLDLPTLTRDPADAFLFACGVYLKDAVAGCYDEDRTDLGVDAGAR